MVVVILSILALVIVPRIIDRPDQARVARVQSDLAALESAVNLYRLDNFRYPTTEQGLEALVTAPVTRAGAAELCLGRLYRPVAARSVGQGVPVPVARRVRRFRHLHLWRGRRVGRRRDQRGYRDMDARVTSARGRGVYPDRADDRGDDPVAADPDRQPVARTGRARRKPRTGRGCRRSTTCCASRRCCRNRCWGLRCRPRVISGCAA